jgi:hypothetical protein
MMERYNRAKLVIVNRDETRRDRNADLVLHEPIGDTQGGADEGELRSAPVSHAVPRRAIGRSKGFRR